MAHLSIYNDLVELKNLHASVNQKVKEIKKQIAGVKEFKDFKKLNDELNCKNCIIRVLKERIFELEKG